MAKKKNPPASEPITTSLSSRLADELSNLKRLTGKAVAIKTDGKASTASLNDLDASINALTLTRALVKDVDTEKKAALEKDIPEAVRKKMDAIETESRRIKTEASALEAQLAEVLNAEVKAERLTESITSAAGCKLILQRRRELVIDNPDLIPEAFTKRVPDMAAIDAVMKDWEIKAEAAKTLELPPPPCPVAGVSIGQKIVLVTKAPELIEE